MHLKELVRQIGRNVHAARVELGQTQEHAAHEAGITVRSWAGLERGESRNPTLETLVTVAEVLRVDVVALLRPPRRTSTLPLAKKTRKRNRDPKRRR